MKDLAQVKLESADEIKRKIMLLCLEHCKSPNDRNLLKVGSYLGDFTNNLRSALNYTMRSFVTTELEPILSASEYKEIKRKLDFPWSDSRASFDNKPVLKHIKSHHMSLYNFLEGVQPYHQGNEWLRHVMRISNRDKHEIINEIKEPHATGVAFISLDGTSYPSPGFFGPDLDRILVPTGKEPHVHLVPYYYRPYGGFAIKGGKWAFFFISIDQVQLGLTQFIENVPQKVRKLTDDLNALI